MRLIVTVLLAVAAIGFTGGFYLSLYFQRQIEVLIGAAILLAFLTWFGSGTDLINLLRDLRKEETEKREKRQQEIRQHTDTLIQKVESDANSSEIEGLDWDTHLNFSRYRKEILQHLYTGQRELFDSLNKAVELRSQHIDVDQKLSPKIGSLVRAEASKHGLFEGVAGRPTFYTSEIVTHIRERLGTKDWDDFHVAERAEGPEYKIRANESTPIANTYATCYSDRAMAEKFASGLNEISKDKDLVKEVADYRELVSGDTKNREQFVNGFGQLVNAVNLKAAPFEGACDACMNLHDSDDRKRFQSEILELKKTKVYKDWVEP